MARNGSNDRVQDLQICCLCNKKVGVAERYLIHLVNEESGERLVFHITREDGFKLSHDQIVKYAEISEKYVFPELSVTATKYKKFSNLLKNLYEETNETEKEVFSKKIFKKIIQYDKKRRADEDQEYESEHGGGFAMAASMA